MKRTKPIAIFDIDGTIFRSSLLIELTKSLVAYGVFPKLAYTEIERKEQRWLDRKGSYEEYLHQVIQVFSKRLKGVAVADVRRLSKLVIQTQKNRVYTYTRDLLSNLRKTHRLIAISGSSEVIVQQFQKAWKFDDVFGTVYESQKRAYTGNVTFVASRDKRTLLLDYCKSNDFSLARSVGVGDTESDISFLQLVSRPIAFNPNAKLLRSARVSHWQIVVERKDVVYRI